MLLDCIEYRGYYIKMFEDGSVDIEEPCGELLDGGFSDTLDAKLYIDDYLGECADD